MSANAESCSYLAWAGFGRVVCGALLVDGACPVSPYHSRDTGPRSEVVEHAPLREGNGSTRTWSRTLRGVPYRFTAVLMPNGERRYVVRRYNGHDDGTPEGVRTGMRFDCAWSPVAFWTVKA